jgi:exopolysaccharide biosynthesis polyprenyl glycosylphosphotransferase
VSQMEIPVGVPPPTLPVELIDSHPPAPVGFGGRGRAAQAQGLRLGRRHRALLLAADALALSLTAVIGATTLRLLDPIRAGDIAVRHVLITAVALGVALHLHGLYRRPASRLRPSAWWPPRVIVRCLPTAALIALGVEAIMFDGNRMTLTAAVAMTFPAVLLIPFGRRLVVRAFGPPTVTRILVVGTGQVAERLTARLRRCSDTQVVGYVDYVHHAAERPTSVLGGLVDLPYLCREHRIDRIIVAFLRTPDQDTLELLRRLRGQVPISIIPRLYELHSWRSEIEELYGLPLMHVPPAALGRSAQWTKRLVDIVGSALAILLLFPVGLALAAAIRLDSPGPAFFLQERSGRAGRSFRMFKFRTMTADAWARRATLAASNEVDGPLFKMQHDPRVTRVGRFLRRTSIDELPQLINVLLGEMSLVGPRPLPVEESDRLKGAALTRFDVAPGMTGLWQVSGRSDLSYADLQHLDSVYVRSWSLLWDLRIMLATPRSVFARRGAY